MGSRPSLVAISARFALLDPHWSRSQHARARTTVTGRNPGDLNNLSVVTTSTELYQTSFGFTQNDLDTALTEFESEGEAAGVRHWYDGFTFGGVPDIYNPWSITHFPRYGTFKNF